MAGFSDYLEKALLEHAFGSDDYTPAANHYVSLHTADPTDDGSGAEVSGNNYSRVEIANNQTTWSEAVNGTLSNAIAIEFPVPSGSWGTVTHFGIWDASTNGNLLAYGALTASKTPGSGDDVSFGIGDLNISLD